ncbi:MAG: substrate-binding domain-containing protein [Elainellaceae cyanobacterium]
MANPRLLTSLGIIVAALGLAYVPIPGTQQRLLVVSGTELQEPLQELEARFEQNNPNIQVDLEFVGSRDIINRYIDDEFDDAPTILIPANGELLQEVSDRWQDGDNPFYGSPEPIAKTLLVGIAWSDRGRVLFPQGEFDWSQVETALNSSVWPAIGGQDNWGSFDLVITDPSRSNSGQLALGLWAKSQSGGTLSPSVLGQPQIQDLFSLVKRSVYQPPRSTDTLLQEFIARGPNDADVALVYESIALNRWEQSAAAQNKPYQIYYLNPSIETVSTAAVVTRDVGRSQAESANEFLDFLKAREQQETFVQFGFRPAAASLDLTQVPESPWAESIPGAKVDPPSATETPSQETLSEIVRLWQRAN